jgi:choline dehydrogenase-like flavoprotein
LQQPLELDEHSANLLHQYDKRKAYLNENLRCFMGRARVAVLSRDLGSRKACGYSGRCLWGCPSESLYTPSLTLQECKSYPNFEYRTGVYVSHFRFGPGGRITSLAAHSSNNGTRFDIDVDKVVLAAGTLCSSQIVLQSIFKDTGEVMQLKGLMDNRQVLMPFVNLHMLGKPYNTQAYQYPQVAIGLETARPFDYVHGLVTTLKTALIHPIVQSIPFDLRTSLSFFRNIHAGLGLININFPDSRRDENYLTLTPAMKSGSPALAMHYQPAEDEKARLASTNKIFRMLLWKLGCIAPPPMTHVRPMGASVHYAGTIPMTAESAPWTATKYCQSRDFPNLYFADGTTFPALPSKNLTFTLMANAVRVAEEAF